MTQADREQLSRMAAGDLGADAAAELRRRMNDEPALMEEHRRLVRLDRRLRALATTPPPPGLDAAVLMMDATLRSPDDEDLPPTAVRVPAIVARARTRPRALSTLLLWEQGARVLPWMLVLGMVLVLAARGVWTAPSAVRAGADGIVIENSTFILDDLRVDVRGRARLEPSDPAERVSGQEREMYRSHLIAFAAGAALTLVVEHGEALVTNGGAENVVSAGSSYPVPQREPSPGEGGAAPSEVEALRQENQRMSERVAALERVAAPGAGSPGAVSPIPWPELVPPGLAAAPFRQLAADAAAEVEGAELVEVDCAEFPCIAVYRTPEDRDVGDALRAVFEGELATGTSLSHMAMVDDDGSGPVVVHVLAAVPPTPDEGLRTRLRERGEAQAQALATEGPPL